MPGLFDTPAAPPTGVLAPPAPAAPPEQFDAAGVLLPATPLRRFDDAAATRALIYRKTLDEVRKIPPVANKTHTLSLVSADYEDPDTVSKKKHKQAILEGGTLGRRIRGVFRLTDNATGDTVDERKVTVAAVPHMSDRGTFILNGNETIMVKDNAATEAHCFHYSVKVWTEEGMIPIGKLVNERMSVRVWSYDFTAKEFVLKPVTGWFRNLVTTTLGRSSFTAPGRLSATFGRTFPTTLWATPEHYVIGVDGEKAPISKAAMLTVVEEQPTASQLQVVYGSLMGDAHLTEEGMYQEAHTLPQKDYLDSKARIFGDFASPVADRERQGNGVDPVRYLSSKSCAFLIRARSLCYANGRKKITQEWLDLLDARGLAFWFGDDGCAHRAWNSTHDKTACLVATIASDKFCAEDIAQLRAWFRERWGIETKQGRNNNIYGERDLGWQIRFSGVHAEKFMDLIAPYLHPSLRYKLAERPPTGRCVGCSKEIDRRRDRCNGCCLAFHVTDYAKSSARSRFGGVAEVKRLLASGEIPPDENLGARWDARMAILGTGVPAMEEDNKPSLHLRSIPHSYGTHQGLALESLKTVFDIEVEDTHNYFANGVLVSNCSVLPQK